MITYNKDKHNSNSIKTIDNFEEIISLGNNAKSTTTITPIFSPNSIDIQGISENKLRLKRYELLSVARDIFLKKGNQKDLRYSFNFHRTSQCKFLMTSNYVEVNKAKNIKSSFYTGLQTCGSVWSCPVCCAKIQEKRRSEVSKALDYFYSNNFQAVLITFTFSHKKEDLLQDILNKFLLALNKMKSGNQFTLFKKRVNFQGLIRSLEITHSEKNGFHPHTHELWFLDKNTNKKDFVSFIQNKFLLACKKSKLLNDNSDLKSFLKRSIDIKFNCRSSDYLNKQDDQKNLSWGIDRELTKSSNKTSHPFSFLSQNTIRSRELFLEFSIAVKGKSQLFWSRGLKNLVNIEDKSDQELSEKEEKSEILGLLDVEQWKFIRRFNLRAQILDIAENKDYEAIIDFIDNKKLSLNIL